MLAPGSVPTDEQLEEELRELEKKTQGKYELAKNDLTLPMLQKMKSDEARRRLLPHTIHSSCLHGWLRAGGGAAIASGEVPAT